MVTFDAIFTEVLFFDLECYVPPEDQEKQGKSSSGFNAGKPNHSIFEEYFVECFPCKETLSLLRNFGISTNKMKNQH